MQLFRALDVAGSLAIFDAVHRDYPALLPRLWQRGLSLYYASRFAEGAEQFRCDTAVNAADAEEALWCCLCETKVHGHAAAVARMLPVGEDPRPALRVALRAFSGSATLEELRAAGAFSAHDFFYAKLYEALLLEARGQEALSRAAMEQALQCAYAGASDDYMIAVARVHAKERGY